MMVLKGLKVRDGTEGVKYIFSENYDVLLSSPSHDRQFKNVIRKPPVVEGLISPVLTPSVPSRTFNPYSTIKYL